MVSVLCRVGNCVDKKKWGFPLEKFDFFFTNTHMPTLQPMDSVGGSTRPHELFTTCVCCSCAGLGGCGGLGVGSAPGGGVKKLTFPFATAHFFKSPKSTHLDPSHLGSGGDGARCARFKI